MKNNFAEIYSQHEALAARYNEASQKNDREGMKTRSKKYKAAVIAVFAISTLRKI